MRPWFRLVRSIVASSSMYLRMSTCRRSISDFDTKSAIDSSSTTPPDWIVFTNFSDTDSHTSSESDTPSSVRKYAFLFLVTPVICACLSIT